MTKRFILWVSAAFGAGLIAMVALPSLGIKSSDPDSVFWWCAAMLVCQFGAVWYFLTNTGFTKGMKLAYTFLSIGILCMGLAQLQIPLLSYFNGWNSLYVYGGIIMIPYVATTLSMYLGTRKLVQLLGLKIIWMRIPVAMIFSIVSSALIVAFFWSLKTSFTTLAYDALVSWATIMGSICVFLAYRARTELTPSLGPAVTWLIAAFYAYVFTGVQHLLLLHLTDSSWWYRLYGWDLWPQLLASILFLTAGLTFRELNRNQSAGDHPLDVLMYTIDLVSRPRDIESVLDRLRVITASIGPDRNLNQEQMKGLASIYLEVEHYLVTREPLRTFTVESLRVRLPDPFLALLPSPS